MCDKTTTGAQTLIPRAVRKTDCTNLFTNLIAEVLGPEVKPLEVAEELARQASNQGTRLKQGWLTCKSLGAYNVGIAQPVRHSHEEVLLSFDDWAFQYGDILDSQDLQKAFAKIDSGKCGQISFRQWMTFLQRSNATENATVKVETVQGALCMSWSF